MTRDEFKTLLKTATITPECQFDAFTEDDRLNGCVWNKIEAPGFSALYQSFYSVETGDVSLESLELGDNYGLDTWRDEGTTVSVSRDGAVLDFDELEDLAREAIPHAFDFNVNVIVCDCP